MKIEFGKQYIVRSSPDGPPVTIIDRVDPASERYGKGFRFYSSEGICYTEDGVAFPDLEERGLDLVSEFIPGNTTTSVKEFLDNFEKGFPWYYRFIIMPFMRLRVKWNICRARKAKSRDHLTSFYYATLFFIAILLVINASVAISSGNPVNYVNTNIFLTCFIVLSVLKMFYDSLLNEIKRK